MVKQLAYVTLTLFFVIPSLAHVQDETFTALGDLVAAHAEGTFETMYLREGMVNGHRWNIFDASQKQGYLFGFEDGLISTAIQYVADDDTRHEAMVSFPTSAGPLSIGDLMNLVDDFYADDRNVSIPISYTLLIIRNKRVGTDEQQTQQYVEYLRSRFGKQLAGTKNGSE